MAGDEGLVTRVGGALDVRFGAWRHGPLASALDFSARAWVDLLLRVFLARVSKPRIDWAAGNPSRRRIFASAGGTVRPCRLLVRADAAVVFERRAHAHGNLLGGHDCVAAAGFKFLAARNARHLLCVFPLVRERRAVFLRLSIRWNAAGSGIPSDVFRAAGNSPGVGRGEPAVAGEPVAADLGMLPNLFRIGDRKNHGRRSAVAAFRGAGRVLPERAAAHVDRVAHAASAALVPCDDGLRDAGAGTGAGVDDVSAAALSDPVLFDRDAVADRNHPLRKLHVSELPGPRAGNSAGR